MCHILLFKAVTGPAQIQGERLHRSMTSVEAWFIVGHQTNGVPQILNLGLDI